MVPTVERGLRLVDFWSIETAGERPSMKSTSGLSICPRNCRAYADSDSTYRRWPSAKIVSKARLDLPDPDSPVNTIRLFRGRSRLTSLRLCSRAPRTTRRSATGCFSPRPTGGKVAPTVATGTDSFFPSPGRPSSGAVEPALDPLEPGLDVGQQHLDPLEPVGFGRVPPALPRPLGQPPLRDPAQLHRVDPGLRQHRDEVVSPTAEQAEQQVAGVDLPVVEPHQLAQRELQRLLGRRGERELPGGRHRPGRLHDDSRPAQ